MRKDVIERKEKHKGEVEVAEVAKKDNNIILHLHSEVLKFTFGVSKVFVL